MSNAVNVERKSCKWYNGFHLTELGRTRVTVDDGGLVCCGPLVGCAVDFLHVNSLHASSFETWDRSGWSRLTVMLLYRCRLRPLLIISMFLVRAAQ